MKIFKISIISIISILIFQSQLYGINLRCDFKRKLNTIDFNGIYCKSYVEGICTQGNSEKYRGWISEVIIKNKDVEIVTELSDRERNNLTNKQKIKRMEELGDRILKVESEVHQKTGFDGKELIIDRYIFVINETKEKVVTKGKDGSTSISISQIWGFYTLYFDNLTKESILTDYWNVHNPDKVRNYTQSYFGECEIE